MIPPSDDGPAPAEVRIFRGLLLFSLLAMALWFLREARVVIMPFAIAALLAYVTNPLVNLLEVRGVSRPSAVAVLYLLFVAAFGTMLFSLFSFWWQEIPRLRYQWPLYQQQVNATVAAMEDALRRELPWVAQRFDLSDAAGRGLVWLQSQVENSPLSLVSALGYAGLNVILVPFVAFYLLKGSRHAFQDFLDACPGRWIEKFLSLLHKADEVVGNYLRGVMLDAVLVGFTVGIGLELLGVRYAALIALFMMLCNFVPYVGALAGGAVAALVAFLQFQTVWAPTKVAVLFVAVRFLDDWIYQPMILKRAVDLHPAALVFVLLCGGEVWGIWGLIVAVPVVCVVKEFAAILFEWYRSERGLTALPAPLAKAAARPWVV